MSDIDTWRSHDECRAEINALASAERAVFWHRMYRHDLYDCTHLHDRVRKKMTAACEAAKKDVDGIMAWYGVETLFLGKIAEALGHVPFWKRVPSKSEARKERLWRRYRYWSQRKNAERVKHIDLQITALVELQEQSWPLSPIALRRARAYQIAKDDQAKRDELIRQAICEREQRENIVRQRRVEQAIAEKAQALMVELMPEIKVTKRMRKAQAFDVLVRLLETSDVDEKTKQAIGKLRKAVEIEHQSP